MEMFQQLRHTYINTVNEVNLLRKTQKNPMCDVSSRDEAVKALKDTVTDVKAQQDKVHAMIKELESDTYFCEVVAACFDLINYNSQCLNSVEHRLQKYSVQPIRKDPRQKTEDESSTRCKELTEPSVVSGVAMSSITPMELPHAISITPAPKTVYDDSCTPSTFHSGIMESTLLALDGAKEILNKYLGIKMNEDSDQSDRNDVVPMSSVLAKPLIHSSPICSSVVGPSGDARTGVGLVPSFENDPDETKAVFELPLFKNRPTERPQLEEVDVMDSTLSYTTSLLSERTLNILRELQLSQVSNSVNQMPPVSTCMKSTASEADSSTVSYLLAKQFPDVVNENVSKKSDLNFPPQVSAVRDCNISQNQDVKTSMAGVPTLGQGDGFGNLKSAKVSVPLSNDSLCPQMKLFSVNEYESSLPENLRKLVTCERINDVIGKVNDLLLSKVLDGNPADLCVEDLKTVVGNNANLFLKLMSKTNRVSEKKQDQTSGVFEVI